MATAKKRSKTTAAARTAAANPITGAMGSTARKAAPAATRKAAGKPDLAAGKPGKAQGKAQTGRGTKAPAPGPNTAGKTSAGKGGRNMRSAAKPSAKPVASRQAQADIDAARPAGRKATQAPRKQGARAPQAEPQSQGEPALFSPLSEGERAAAVRILTEEPRLASMANVGRYRVISVEPVVVKPSHELAGRRLARIVAYDYAAERSVDACIDLDKGAVTHLDITRSQPQLAPEEEAAAIAIALRDEQVQSKLSAGEQPLLATHYWSRTGTSLAFSRRSAAVLFGQPGSSPTLITVVDLLDNLVCEIVPAAEW